MSDLTSLHSQAKKLILLLREGLERVEALEVWCCLDLPRVKRLIQICCLERSALATSGPHSSFNFAGSLIARVQPHGNKAATMQRPDLLATSKESLEI